MGGRAQLCCTLKGVEMATFKLEISVEIPDDLDIDTVRAVSQREDVQVMFANLVQGTLLTIVKTDLEKARASGKPPLASEATRRINLLPINLLKAAALTNNYGKLPLHPLVDALVGEVLELHEQGKVAIDDGNYVYALTLAEMGEQKIGRIPELI
jgi:hypothetical protein